ncbi:MAG: hypothetical protein R2875_16750 [Desulfobacterales bacterium]
MPKPTEVGRTDLLKIMLEMAANTIEECDKLIEIINTMMDISWKPKPGSARLRLKIDVIKLIMCIGL